jgi:carbonic anhydrase/acetyltransferase-like protein (isoleucine patch superfamily)
MSLVYRQTSCTTEEEDAFHLHLEAHRYALAHEIPDNSLVMGTPGKVVKLLTPEQVSH